MSLIAQLHYLLALWPSDKSKRKKICNVMMSTIIILGIKCIYLVCSLGIHFEKIQHFGENNHL